MLSQLGDSCVFYADVVTFGHIQCGTALKLERINYTTSQTFGNFVLKYKEIGQTYSGKKCDFDSYRWNGHREKTLNLGTDFPKMSSTMFFAL